MKGFENIQKISSQIEKATQLQSSIGKALEVLDTVSKMSSKLSAFYKADAIKLPQGQIDLEILVKDCERAKQFTTRFESIYVVGSKDIFLFYPDFSIEWKRDLSRDENLIEYLIQNKIALTVCPLSNIKLKVFEHMSLHNIKKLCEKGVAVTINSDDPAYFGGYVLENYIQCQQHLNFTSEQMAQIALNSFEHSFLSASEKEGYLQQFSHLLT